MNYEIKPCAEGDTDRLWKKFDEAYKALAPAGQDAEEERLVFKVSDDKETIIGGCVVGIDASKNAEFERLWVDELCRGRGMASALIREAEHAAKAKGCHVMINAYSFDFQAARPLFEKHGYRLIGIAENWPEGHESYTLLKRLDNPLKECGAAETDAMGYEIKAGSEEDGALIADRLEAYNSDFAPRTHPYLDLDKKLVDEEGGMVAGCIAGVSGWDTLHIDMLWVDECCRNQGVGAYLLGEIEREAKENGAYLARTDAMDVQAAFFIKRGYAVTVVYEDEPKWYVMQKPL